MNELIVLVAIILTAIVMRGIGMLAEKILGIKGALIVHAVLIGIGIWILFKVV